MEKIRRYAQSLPITFESWLISFVGIVLIRIFFEQFSSFDIREPFILIDVPTLVHYSLLYLVEILGLMIILLLFTKIKINKEKTNGKILTEILRSLVTWSHNESAPSKSISKICWPLLGILLIFIRAISAKTNITITANQEVRSEFVI